MRHGFQAAQKISGHLFNAQSKKILELRARNHYRDPVGKSHHHGPRNIFHRAAQPGHAQKDQEHAGDSRTHEQAVNAVFGHDPGHYDHERAGRSANLHARSAQRRNQKSGNHRAVKSCLRRHARRNRKCHSQRQRHQPNRDARDQVSDKVLPRIILQGQYGFWDPLGAHRAPRWITKWSIQADHIIMKAV